MGRCPVGWGARAAVCKPGVRGDDRPREHSADSAGRGCAGSDKRGMDGLQRPEPSHSPAGGSSGGPAEGALIPA
jgi:hypothetical protein